ncbi:hypothetical protein GCK32_018642 [Trichostrongylus colubriformis]|uniref:Uncharacterized protein n=1 Tax=Trichostrongylus colubriformis TaxID=6319 RepID=A0AAN8FRN9_TRICO
MFWKGFTDFGQLIAFVISGIIAVLDWKEFPFFLNKVVYALATIIFVIAVIEKMTPWSTYFFNVETLDWQYKPGDDWVSSSHPHACKVRGCKEAVSGIMCNSFQKKRSMKVTEVVLTVQHFCVSLLYTFGFIYWSFVDVWASGNVMTNFLSNLTWILIIGLNPFIYLSVNKRLRKAVLVLIRISKDYPNQTITVLPKTATALTPTGEKKWRTFMIAVKMTRH